MSPPRRERGRRAERRGRVAETLAVWFLRAKGYRILARRLKPPKGGGGGEIDVVAARGGVLAFVEIKARPGSGEGLAAIRPRQRQRIERAAEWFLQTHPGCAYKSIRFDALVLVPWRLPRHLADAWRPDAG